MTTNERNQMSMEALNSEETIWALKAIDSGTALAADVEYDLEERGLIVQSHQPYATLTAAGRALIFPEPYCRRTEPHNCFNHAEQYTDSDGPLGHGWTCGVCGAVLQVG